MPTPMHDQRPPYQQAADAIRDDITAGRLKPGERLPSNRELEERFGVANMTARSALRVLRDEGLIYTVQGRGSYVTDTLPPSDGSPREGMGQPGLDEAGAEGPVTEVLMAIRDQLRALNAEVETLKREVTELKDQRREHPTS
ncbi:GntR family transcriptional regulator [Streptomyces sp. NPDC050610]|uniref:GntR family transcriptional regulator n=1 Tax=Streptomyces sp. NPDC050610 TaxID=3157097 RepID=UPI003430EF0B